MDDRRFDSLTRSLASGASRRSLLKGLLELGGAAIAGGALLEGDAGAAARPTPTPKPVKCPGNQVPVGGVCTCPASAPNKCGPACCTSVSGAPPTPTHTECCDNACCHGTCYGEELCCPTNPGAGEQPSTHQICRSANGVECCPADQHCCEVDGCCDTVCWGGEDDNSNCCPSGAFCPGNDSPDLCCTNNFICCGAGTSGNLCRDPNVEGGCCRASDCASGQICENNLCVTPCNPATVQIFAQMHGPLESQYICPGPFEGVVTEIGLYPYANGACADTPIATATTGVDSPAVFTDIAGGQYCALPTDGSVSACLDCPDYGEGVGVDLTVPCGGQLTWTIGLSRCCVEGVTVPVFVHAPSNGCSQGPELAGVPIALYDCESDELLYGPVSSNDDGYADIASVLPGIYCVRVSENSSYSDCQSCQDNPLYRSRIEVTCGQTVYPLIGICQQGQHCDDGVCEDDVPCEGRCTDLEVCVDDGCYCRPGTYDDFNGTCVICEPGTYSDMRGAFECSNCGLNTYQDQSGQTGCIPCPEGTYTEHVKQTECIECDCQAGNMPPICGCAPPTCEPGYAPQGNICAACAAGTYSPDGLACLDCSLGTYQDLEGQIGCAPCAVGSYTEHVGSTSCLVCNCGNTCDPTTGVCPGGLPDYSACQQDSDCQSGNCGCGAPPGFPECFCRIAECQATGTDCAGSAGAVVCCEGDCTCFGGNTDCVCTVPA